MNNQQGGQGQNNRGDQNKQNFGNKVPDDKNKDLKNKPGEQGSDKTSGDDRRNI